MRLWRVFACDFARPFWTNYKPRSDAQVSPYLLHKPPPHVRTRTHTHTHTHTHTQTHTQRYYRPFGVRAGSIEFPLNHHDHATAPYIIVSDQPRKAKDAKGVIKLHLSMKVCAWCVAVGWAGWFVGMAWLGNEAGGSVHAGGSGKQNGRIRSEVPNEKARHGDQRWDLPHFLLQ